MFPPHMLHMAPGLLLPHELKLARGTDPKRRLRRRRARATTLLRPSAARASTLLGVASFAKSRRILSRSLV